MKVTIGGNRLGSGNKMKAETPTYSRSTHDLSYIYRGTQAVGTLVPFMCEVGLRGDTWDIDLEAHLNTLPTIGPLFGSMKFQMDIFTADMRLYNAKLHNNALEIGMKMNEIYLPQVQLASKNPDFEKEYIDNSQIGSSCIFKYLGINGLGTNIDSPNATRKFNALSWISYWDIYKNYYANRQEKIGAVIHNEAEAVTQTVDQVDLIQAGVTTILTYQGKVLNEQMTGDARINVNFTGARPKGNEIIIGGLGVNGMVDNPRIDEVFTEVFNGIGYTSYTGVRSKYIGQYFAGWEYVTVEQIQNDQPNVVTFDLTNIDKLREEILYHRDPVPFDMNAQLYAPYSLVFEQNGDVASIMTSQEGLALKTYQSDIFNNWMDTEWISGAGGINEITAISTATGEFTIDTLIMKRKVYNMLNAVMLSGGTYYDWLNVNWEEETQRPIETPIYHGGLSKELIFQEVISNSEAVAEGERQPLGTLAGRGKLNGKHKGGKVRIKVKEHCYIMGLASLTPRLDYSQGNRWDVNMRTMDDWHKPALDNIGFQDLITDQMAWWDTKLVSGGAGTLVPQYRSAGKLPAWINYMTNYNRVYGNFAEQTNQGWMVLNRQYQHGIDVNEGIKDLTTYIDPLLYNNVFAETQRNAQNIWVQIGVNAIVRRLMSAKVMPHG